VNPRRTAMSLVVLAAAALQAACGTVPAESPKSADVAPAPARMLPPDRGSAAEVRQRLGEPHRRTVFLQGHEVWHYHYPDEGQSLRSWLPGAHLASTERGRRATEFVLLFDAQGQLVQSLTRELR
jgi:hypothetical protein